jgi:hypothetical protein
MDKIGKRIKILGSEIHISSPKNIFMLIFLPIWLTGWTIGGVVTIGVLVTGKAKEAWFLVIWLCGWIVGESFALYTFLWGLFGFEVITVEFGNLKIKRSILGYGPSKNYEISKLSNLRASGFFGPMMSWSSGMAYWGLSGGTIAFDYEGKTKRFGISLNEDDSNQLVEALKTRLNL